MIDERQQELAALHALDLLEGAENAAFEAELKNNPELQKLVSELRDSSAAFALTAPQVAPSPELKGRLMAKIGATDQQPTPAPGVVTPGVTVEFKLLRFRPSVIIPWAMAAGFAIGCVWLGQLYDHARTENAILQDQHRLAEVEITSGRNQLEAERILASRQVTDATQQLTQLNQQLVRSTEKIADATRVLGETYHQLDEAKAELLARQGQLAQVSEKLAAATTQISDLRERLRVEGDLAQFKIATLASLAGNSPQALAVAVWNPTTQQGVLRVEKLPALASDKDYQLWLIDPAYPSPVDGGVFTVDSATGHAQVNFKPNQRVNNAAKFAVSLERKGGVPKPEGAIVLLGD
jgi:anti-sigma-K factor RskA